MSGRGEITHRLLGKTIRQTDLGEYPSTVPTAAQQVRSVPEEVALEKSIDLERTEFQSQT